MNSTTANERNLEEVLLSDPFGDNRGTMNSSEDDAKLHVEFFMEPAFQEFESKSTPAPQRKIYKDTEYIKIYIPGDKQTAIIRQVFPSDRSRWPQQYARFQQGLADQVVGTPISSMPSIPAEKVKEYEFFHIRTIEQLADCPDGSQCGQAMRGFHEDKRKAQQFVEAAKGAAPVAELKKQLEERDEMLKKLSDRLSTLEAEQSNAKAAVKAK